MIRLTRLNNTTLMLNADLIKFVEQAPDTVITLITGDKVVVRESADQVMASVIEFRRALIAAPDQPPATGAQDRKAE